MRRAVLTAVVCACAACEQRTPTAPTPSPPSFEFQYPANAFVFLQGPSIVFSSAPVDYRFVIQTGAERLLIEKADWKVDNERIARIERTGRLHPVGFGITFVTGTYRERRAQLQIRVVPDLNGVWQGPARVTRCTGRFCDPRSCRNIQAVTYTISLRLVQRNTEVEGEVLTVPSVGHIRESGTLVMKGTVARDTPLGPSVTTIDNFAADLVGDTLRGGFRSFSEAPGTHFGFFPCGIREQRDVDYEFSQLRRVSP